jgi:CRISPR-associated protein Cas2
MAATGKYVIIYDISDDRERSRLSSILEGFGFRVQESAFECLLNRAARRELIAEIEKLELATGFVNIYRVNDIAKTVCLGKPPTRRPDADCAFVV